MMYIQMHRTFRRINLIFNIEWCLHLDRKCETRFTSEIVFYGPVRTSRDSYVSIFVRVMDRNEDCYVHIELCDPFSK